jgi:nitroreductase
MSQEPTISPETLVARLNWRYAAKRFDPAARIPPGMWNALEQSLVLAPSSYGLQPWKFVVVTDPAVKAALVGHSWNQTQPADCSHFVVFCLRTGLDAAHVDRFLDLQVAVRGGSPEALAGYRKLILGSLDAAVARGDLDVWQTHQVYIALGQFMAAAAILGVDTCPMEGIVPAEYDRLLGLAGTGFRTVVACAAGYRAADDKYATAKKVRFPAAEVVQHV